jgi:lysophospholipase L1-like esterase
MRVSRTLASITAAAALAVGSFLVAAPASAAPPASSAVPYAALGDSYAAGFGGGMSEDACGRSPNGYPQGLVGIAHIQLAQDLACSGATAADVMTYQVPGLSPASRLVTLTVGGDDVGFYDIVVACFALPSSPQQQALCAAALAAGRAALDTVPGKVAATVAAIRAQAPGARVVVTGYPLLFRLPSAYGDAAAQLNQAIPLLNAAIEAGATAAGATYVDVTQAFSGHGIGSAVPWINDFTPATPNTDAFHPNASGYRAYANALKPFVG